jgi:predicted membrane channel-forming protein YqfA (hemolysin III family)
MPQTKGMRQAHRTQDSLAPFRRRARWRRWQVYVGIGWLVVLALGTLLLLMR